MEVLLVSRYYWGNKKMLYTIYYILIPVVMLSLWMWRKVGLIYPIGTLTDNAHWLNILLISIT